MKHLVVLFIAFFSLSTTHAQDAVAYAVNDDFNFWNLTVGQTSYVFADNAYIRAYPATDAQLIDSVTAGTAVKITSIAYNGNKVKGFYAPWHEVTYQKDNQTKTGFIWLGLLALGQHTDSNGNRYIYGFDRYVPEKGDAVAYYISDVKLFSPDGIFIAKHSFHCDYSDQSFIQSKLLPNMGLDGLQNIFRVDLLGEACGIPSEYYYVAWNGKQFIDMPRRYSVGDAGAFYHEETLLFPSEHKKEANMVYKMIEDAEYEDIDDPNPKVTKKQEKYIWDGKVFSQLLEMKIIE